MNKIVAIQPGEFVKKKKERNRILNHCDEEKDDERKV